MIAEHRRRKVLNFGEYWGGGGGGKVQNIGGPRGANFSLPVT